MSAISGIFFIGLKTFAFLGVSTKNPGCHFWSEIVVSSDSNNSKVRTFYKSLKGLHFAIDVCDCPTKQIRKGKGKARVEVVYRDSTHINNIHTDMVREPGGNLSDYF